MTNIINIFLLPKRFKKTKQKGFTLIELLVTISMMAIVTTGIFGYSRNSENQNNLNRAQQRLMFELRRAESMAMNNYKNPNDDGIWARWGIVMKDGESYEIGTRTCSDTELIDANKETCVRDFVPFETIELPAGVSISPTEVGVYFLAPEPAIYTINNTKLIGNDIIIFTLHNIGKQKTATVTVNSIGQVN